jgi:hypothetical protein
MNMSHYGNVPTLASTYATARTSCFHLALRTPRTAEQLTVTAQPTLLLIKSHWAHATWRAVRIELDPGNQEINLSYFRSVILTASKVIKRVVERAGMVGICSCLSDFICPPPRVSKGFIAPRHQLCLCVYIFKIFKHF